VKAKNQGVGSRSVIEEYVLARDDKSIYVLIFRLGWDEALNNTVSGITVLGYVGRSGFEPDASPSEVSRPWQAKIPQAEK
jgi:hypothetical protein